MRIFLTGANGYLGGLLSEHFSRVPEINSITGIDVLPPKRPLPEKMRFIAMDVRSPEVSSAMKGHDVVVHTAFIVYWYANMPATERDDINFKGTRNVAEAAVANKVRTFVHSSSTAAYDLNMSRGGSSGTEDFPLGRGDSSSYYANSKAAAERILTEIIAPTGITLTILRPTFIIGPRNTITTESLRELTIKPLGHEHARLQYIHEEDAAAAFTQAVLTNMPGAYNVVPDDYLPLSEVQKIVGVTPTATIPVEFVRVTMDQSWKHSGSRLHPSWFDLLLVDATSSNAKLRATGWKPRYSTAEALRSAPSRT